MAGDPFGLLLKQRIVFLGGEVGHALVPCAAPTLLGARAVPLARRRPRLPDPASQVNDFSADAVISQLLLLDAQDGSKVGLASQRGESVGAVERGGRSRNVGGCWLADCPPPPSPPPRAWVQDIKLFINSPGGSVTAGMGIYDAMMMCRSEVQTYCFGLAASMGAFLLGAGAKGKRYSMPNRCGVHACALEGRGVGGVWGGGWGGVYETSGRGGGLPRRPNAGLRVLALQPHHDPPAAGWRVGRGRGH